MGKVTPTNEEISETERLSKLGPEEIRILYVQYSEWARHHHALIWIISSFGIGIALGGLTLFEKLNKRQFTALGAACLALLHLFYLVAEGNRAQWSSHWRFLNLVEAHWGVRDPTKNKSGPLSSFLFNRRRGATRRARLLLMWTCAGAWLLAIILKLTM